MAIGSNIEERAPWEMDVYPAMGIADDGLIVLFSCPRKGAVIRTGDSSDRVGFYSDSWIMSRFKKYQGKITLWNE